MGKCKICDTETFNENDLCEDCKALQDIDLIKSDEDLEELLNLMMNTHSNNPKNSDDQDKNISIEPISMDEDVTDDQMNGNMNDLLPDDNYVNSFDELKNANIQDIEITDDYIDGSNVDIEDSTNLNDNMFDYLQNEEKPNVDEVIKSNDSTVDASELQSDEESYNIEDINEFQSEDETIDMNAFQSEEEPIDINMFQDEEEPIDINMFQSEEEPIDINMLQNEEEPIDINMFQSEEEPIDINMFQSEEEPIDMNAFQSEEELYNNDSLSQSEEEAFDISAFQSDEQIQNDEMSTATADPFSFINAPELKGIFDGIELDDDIQDNKTNVSDLYSDVLGTVSNYGNDSKEEPQIINSKSKKAKKAPEKEKVGFFKRIFANIQDSDTEQEFQREKQQEEEDAKKREAKKEEKVAKIAAKKSAKAEAKRSKASTKAAAKALAKEKKEEDIVEVKDEGRINKAGASVVFVLLAAITVVIIIGTNKFSYAVNIKQAQDYFTMRKYTKAYTQISGLDIQKSDEELYKKIRTVMYVNREYDSYNNYFTIEYYAEALNSLLNGLNKYDKYIAEASELGVKSDLQYVKNLILDELKEKYHLTEDKAMEMVNISNKEKYSEKVFEIAEQMVEK
ncbi:MAG TPA: hypothetical protein VHP81_10715 [Lachnospiraceae bacterium]|nr:hypothetical protein [Lachnospiraceae bacterium]